MVWLNTSINHLLKDILGPVDRMSFAQAINDCIVCHNIRGNTHFKEQVVSFIHLTLTKETFDDGVV